MDERWFVAMHKDLEGRAAAVERAGEQSTSEIPVRRFYALTLVGSERHEEFLRLVRRLVDADAEPCYSVTARSGQLPQSAVLIDDQGARAQEIEEQLLAEVRDWGEGVSVEYQASEVRPYLLRQIVVSGTDNRRFALRDVPSTTVLSEIARAVLQNYTDTDLASVQRDQIQIMIHRIGDDGRLEHLDPEHRISDAGIQDGDELRVATVATSLTVDETRRLVAELRQLLPELFDQEVDARAVLEEAGRGRGWQAVWRDPASFWSAELAALQRGAVRGGIQALVLAAAAEYPANGQLAAMLAEVRAAPAAELRPPAVATSLTEDQTRRLAAELRQLLPELFDQEPDARALLASIGRPHSRQAAWHTPAAFWDSELRALLLGVIRGGIQALVLAAAALYPANGQLAAMLAEVRAAPAAELRPPAVATSLTEDQTRRLAAELRQLLPELFDQEPDARALLASIGRPRSRQAAWHTPAAFWDSELRALLLGVIRSGIQALVLAATAEYPANGQLAAMLAEVRAAPAAELRPPAVATSLTEDQTRRLVAELRQQLLPEPTQQFHSLTLVGSERHDDFLRLVRRLVDADAEPCYATTAQSGQLPLSAVLIGDPGPRATQIEEQLLAEVRDWGEGVTVEYHTSETRPYLLRQIVVSGTDNRRFALRNVPSTTSLSEIARAVLQNYTDDATRARHSGIRITIDRISKDGQAERLNPNRMLGDVGIHDGDELRLVTWSPGDRQRVPGTTPLSGLLASLNDAREVVPDQPAAASLSPALLAVASAAEYADIPIEITGQYLGHPALPRLTPPPRKSRSAGPTRPPPLPRPTSMTITCPSRCRRIRRSPPGPRSPSTSSSAGERTARSRSP